MRFDKRVEPTDLADQRLTHSATSSVDYVVAETYVGMLG